VIVFSCLSSAFSQQTALKAPAASSVPRLVSFGDVLHDSDGKPQAGTAGITFAIYKDQFEGAPLWIETQNVMADKAGRYTVQLGSTTSDGLPVDLFVSGEARWLGVRVSGQTEQPRVLLLSVPYALKAADAQTLGGLPPSAFVLASPSVGAASPEASTATGTAGSPPVPPPATITGSGTTNFLPIFTGAAAIGNSALFQSGASPTAKIGINTNSPAATLDVKGTETVRGLLTLPATGVATPSGGKNSQPQNFVASAFNSASSTVTTETFRLQAEPVGNNTAITGGSLNVLFGQGTTAPMETGLKIRSNGQITFAAGQQFPGTGKVTSVGLSAPASDFTVTGSPVTGSGTLQFAWTVPPSSSIVPSSIVKRDANGDFSSHSIAANRLYGDKIFANSSDGFAVISAGTSNGTALVGYSTAPGGPSVLGMNAGNVCILRCNYLNLPTGVAGDAPGIGVLATSDFGKALVAANNNSSDTVTISKSSSGGGTLYLSGPGGAVHIDSAGDIFATGSINGGAKNFRIDHPLDPANKYLIHTSVESPDMKTVYDGIATLDANGQAWVKLPEYFEALNFGFRYQLTCIGGFAPVFIAKEIAHNQFQIGGGKPGMRISWLVTGIRHDAWANAHRVPVEQAKPEKERGFYLHPELFGVSEEKSIARAGHPEAMKRAKDNPPQAPSMTTPVSARR
jgi:hypothetical protein